MFVKQPNEKYTVCIFVSFFLYQIFSVLFLFGCIVSNVRECVKEQSNIINVVELLADRTNGRAIGTVLHPSSSSSSVTLCIVAKRCVLEQKLLLRAYRKSYVRNRLVPK